MAALNKVILIGNVVNDPELKTTTSGISVTTFTVAVQRKKPKDGGESKADFINIVAWRQTAEFITRFFGKGKPILVEGQIQTRQFEKDGVKKNITEVLAENVSFVDSLKRDDNETAQHFTEVAANEELPF